MRPHQANDRGGLAVMDPRLEFVRGSHEVFCTGALSAVASWLVGTAILPPHADADGDDRRRGP